MFCLDCIYTQFLKFIDDASGDPTEARIKIAFDRSVTINSDDEDNSRQNKEDRSGSNSGSDTNERGFFKFFSRIFGRE